MLFGAVKLSRSEENRKMRQHRMSRAEREQTITRLTREMKEAARLLEFEHAAFLRDKIKELEDKFSKKLNANIEFESKKVDYDGIKIELSDLGFEASFSMNLFKEKLTEHILKAIK